MAFRLQWPTKSRKITQHFLANPDDYARFNLPGHEGLDLKAGRGAEIFACAEGEVIEAQMADDKHPYGRRITLRHVTADGIYKTIYAHLLEVKVQIGWQVRAGQLIGLADNTGNSFGNHLHLTLKKEGASARGETTFITEDGRICTFNNDNLDPTAYLDPPPASIPVRPYVLTGDPSSGTTTTTTPPPVTVVTARPDHPLRGLHGDLAANWMLHNRVRGWAVETVYAPGDLIETRSVDYSAHEAAGIRVLVRWNYSYAKSDGGAGTFPKRERYPEFINWCIRSITGSKGVWGHIIGNEPNRSGERPDPNDPITAQDILTVYNAVWDALPKATRVSPPAIDPTNAETANPIDYWREIVQGLKGVEFFALHGYSYGADQPINSPDKFRDHPLTWQFHSFRMWEPLASLIFDNFPQLIPVPLVITETNHLFSRDNVNVPGWDHDSDGWIARMYDYVAAWNRGIGGQYVHGVCLYRFAGDGWGIEQRRQLLDKLINSGEQAL